ncbi:hypothetical protein BDR07DRAFT_1376376 [Suillus spraguei]|nr:hypothetical protein BDR07DRAFT_1376376 [Suillus spraguei]
MQMQTLSHTERQLFQLDGQMEEVVLPQMHPDQGSCCSVYYASGADTKLAPQDAQEAAKHMHPLSRPAITVISGLKGVQEDLDAVDSFEDTYLKPLKIFNTVITKVHSYAKMALGLCS